MKIKIGFLTTHRCDNYGSVLQSFAFQTKLTEWGYEVEIIDYYHKDNTIWGQLISLRKKSPLIKNPFLYALAYIAFGISYINRKRVFNRYRSMNLNLTSQTYHTANEIFDNNPKEDIYCLGSDQTLNGTKELEALDGISGAIKVTYASSFGRDIFSEDELIRMKNYLERYQALSCRESVGLDIMNRMQLNNVNWNIDPALLMTADEWRECGSSKYQRKKYIAVYNLHHDKRIEKLQKLLSKRSGLPVYNICNQWFEFYRYGKFICSPRVEDFLSLLDNAEYIIGDSFHAVAFSILFHKKFLSIVPEYVGCRIESILKLLGLEDRMIDWSSDIDYLSLIGNQIDYERIDNILMQEREKAKKYILSWKELYKNAIDSKM